MMKFLHNRNRPDRSFYVIAEASGNHARNKTKAIELIAEAAGAGADAIKFQTFEAEEIAADNIQIMKGYNLEHDTWIKSLGVSTLRELFSLGGLPRPWHKELKDIAEDMGIDFLSTPFSVDAAKFLVEEIGVKALKIASGDLTFTPLLKYANGINIPVILSTGASYQDEVVQCVTIYLSSKYTCGELAILHCVSSYPCPIENCHLLAIQSLAKRFPNAEIGWSDHTRDTGIVPAMAFSLGARIFEKHITLYQPSNDKKTIDARHSLLSPGFKRMVNCLENADIALGVGGKEPYPSEYHDRLWARRSPADWLRPTEEARQGRWE